MARNNLLEFVRDYFERDSAYLENDNGFRRWTYTYSATVCAARAFCQRLIQAGINKGDRVLLWSDSSPQWMFAFLGSLRAQAVVVPIGAEASSEFVDKIREAVKPRAIVLGENVQLAAAGAARVFHLATENWKQPAPGTPTPKPGATRKKRPRGLPGVIPEISAAYPYVDGGTRYVIAMGGKVAAESLRPSYLPNCVWSLADLNPRPPALIEVLKYFRVTSQPWAVQY